MEQKHKVLMQRRLFYLYERKGQLELDNLVLDWIDEFHGRIKDYRPTDYLDRQVRYLYFKVAREYQRIRRLEGKLWQKRE